MKLKVVTAVDRPSVSLDPATSGHPLDSTSAPMWVAVLDGLVVLRDGQPVGPSESASQQRALLRHLALRANHEVSKDTLVDALWERPPASARNIVEKYVSTWRRSLGPGRLTTTATGYRLTLDTHECDLLALRARLHTAQNLLRERRFAEAATQARTALELWGQRCIESGAPAHGLGDARDLDLYLETVEIWARASLEAGQDPGLVQPLRAAWLANPFRERLPELLMWTLFRNGRQQEAADVFQRARRRLVDELGVEPGPGLQDMLTRVLDGDRNLFGTGGTSRVVQLPHRNPTFTGRDADLEFLTSVLGPRGPAGRGVVVHGSAGMGKSSLVLEHAHRHLEDYACVWWLRADLRSSLTKGLEDLARALEVSVADTGDDRFGALWTRIARDRALLVLDDAGEPGEITPLLPSPAPCDLLVTTLDPAWGDWAVAIELAAFSPADARALVARTAAPDSVEELSAVCSALDGHPLGIVQALAYMRRTGMSAGEYLTHFRRTSRELLRRGVPDDHPDPLETTWALASSSLTERHESATTAELLAVLAFAGRGPLPLAALEEVADLLPGALRHAVRDGVLLEDAISEARRYSLLGRDRGELTMHYLTQLVIAGSMEPVEAQGHQRTFGRLVVRWAETADEVPDRWRWLVPQVTAAAGSRWAPDVAGLVDVMCASVDHLMAVAASTEAGAMAERAVDLARGHVGERVRLGRALTRLGEAREAEGDLGAALTAFPEALEVLENALGANHPATARAMSGLTSLLTCHDGVTMWRSDQLAEADERFERSVEVLEHASGTDQSTALGRALSGWGQICQDSGDLRRARSLQERALTVLAGVFGPEHPEIGHLHDKLAVVLSLQGELVEAEAHFDTALAILRGEEGPGLPTAWTLSNQSLLFLRAGRPELALRVQEEARDLFDGEPSQPFGSLITRWRVAQIVAALGRAEDAQHLLDVVVPQLVAQLGADHPDAINAGADLRSLQRSATAHPGG